MNKAVSDKPDITIKRASGLAQYLVLIAVISIPLIAYLFYETEGTNVILDSILSTDQSGIRFRALVLFIPLITIAIAYLVNEREKYLYTVMVSKEVLRQKNEELVAFNERLAALRSIDMAISTSIDLQATINILIENISAQLKVDAVGLFLVAPDTKMLVYSAGKGLLTDRLENSKITVGRGFAGKVAQNREKLCINNLDDYLAGLSDEESKAVKESPFYKDEKISAYFGFPLVAHDKLLGVLEILHRTPLDPGADWLDLLDTFAAQAAIAIDKASLFSDLQDSNIELVKAYDATIEGWAKALDYRDKETEGHSRRVTELTVLMAKAMGIDGEELLHLRRGALLHDIGKMGVPDRILLKPGALDPDEREVMERHPGISYNLIASITFLKPIIDIPYCHHERWDGAGYPRGLRGKDIPLSARIFSIVDVWDALRSDRPYRKKWSVEQTIEHIRAGAGTQFDPDVVDSFMEHIGSYEENKDSDPADEDSDPSTWGLRPGDTGL